MGIIAPKGGTCGAAGPLSDRSCLNLEREDSFYYPLPAADIWGHLPVAVQASRGSIRWKREGRSHRSSKEAQGTERAEELQGRSASLAKVDRTEEKVPHSRRLGRLWFRLLCVALWL